MCDPWTCPREAVKVREGLGVTMGKEENTERNVRFCVFVDRGWGIGDWAWGVEVCVLGGGGGHTNQGRAGLFPTIFLLNSSVLFVRGPKYPWLPQKFVATIPPPPTPLLSHRPWPSLPSHLACHARCQRSCPPPGPTTNNPVRYTH